MSPHDDGAAIFKLRETPRWKCGEIYTWNNAELYAVECLLCDDKNLCTLTDFATHMKDCHRSWECCSEDSVDNKINNGSTEEHPTATIEVEQSQCTLMTQANGKVAQWIDAKEQEASNEKKAVDSPVQQSVVLEVIVDEVEQVLQDVREIAQEKIVGGAAKTSEQIISKDEMWRALVSEATADEAKDSPCAPLSTNLQKQTLTEIAAGQEPRQHFEEVMIQHVIPVAEGVAPDKAERQKINNDVVTKYLETAGSSIDADVENDEAKTIKGKEISTKLVNNECEKQMEETMEQPTEVLLSKTAQVASHNASHSQSQSILQLSFNKILYLIELYEAHPRLWIPTHQEFSETDLCRESWQEITQKFNAACKHNFKTNELKIGISTLCQRYRAEKQRLADERASDCQNIANNNNNNAKFSHFTALQFLDDQPDAMQSRRSLLQQQNFQIIEIYKRFPVLWHSSNKLKHSSDERAKALDDISDALKLDHIHLSSRSVQRRLHALHKCYRKEKISYLYCLRDNREFRTNFKHYNQMQFLEQHIAPYVCSVCDRIFEKLHEHLEHMRTSHDDVQLSEQESEESEEVPQHNPMDQDMDITEDVTQMLDANDNFVNKEQQLENQNMDQTVDVEYNQNNNTDSPDSNSFKEQQDKVLMDGSDVDKFLANLLEKEPFMEIAAEIFNETNAKHEVGSLMHKIRNNECMSDTSAHNLKEEDTINVQRMPFDFSADFTYAMDEIIQQSSNVNTEPKIDGQTNVTKDVASSYDVAYAMITPDYTPTSLDSATNSVSSPQHYLTSPRNYVNSPQADVVSNSPHHVANSPQHLMHTPQPPVANGPTHFLSSTPHIIISSQDIVNSPQQLISPMNNNNMMNIINAQLNTFDTIHYASSTADNTINIMQDAFNIPEIYFETQQNSFSNSHDIINIPEQAMNAPQYAIITSQEAMALINNEIHNVNMLKAQDNALKMATQNTATNISDFMPTKTVNLAQNLSISQNSLNIAQNNSMRSHNVMNIPQNALNNVMNITQHVVNIPQDTINYPQPTNYINLPQLKTNTQPKTYYVTQKIVNIPPNSLNSSNAAPNAQTYAKENNAQTAQNICAQQNLPLDDLTAVNSRDSCTTHSQVDSSLMGHNDYSSISSESFTHQMQQNTASMEPTSSETVTTTDNKTDFKNLTLRLKNSFTNQSDEDSCDYTSQDSHIQCEVYIENINNTSQDYIPLLSVPPTSRLSEEQTHTLINMYKKHPALWNPTNANFNSKNIRHVAWKTLTITFNKFYKLRLPWQSIYKKMSDLVKYYRKEKERMVKKKGVSKWFYYLDFEFLDEYLDITSDIHKTLQEKELNLKIIEMYKSFPQLWNTHMQEFKKRSQRNRHIAAMHNCLQQEENIQITLERLKRKLLDFRCSFRQEKEKRIEYAKNNEAFESFYEYYQQLEFLEPHISPFICKVCDASFKKLTEILRHYRDTKHQKISKKRIQRSEYSQESDCKHICHICGAKFTMRNNLVYHLNRHLGKRTHLCNVCPKSFYNSTSLRVHERSHTKECPYVCEQCGQAFVNNSKLNQHLKRHNSKKEFKCDICEKAFYTAVERDKHVKRHLKIRDQVCPICGKAFVVGSSIYTHMELHSGVKKYVCKICDKKFAQNSGLYRHMKQHKAKNENTPSS